MNTILKRKLHFTISLLHSGDLKSIWEAFKRRLKSEEIAYGFRRDLDLEYNRPKSLKKISIRKAIEQDAPFFKDRRNDGLIEQFETCYVAITPDNTPCCRLWLIDASQNEKLRNTWGETFPELKENEVLIENVFTIPKFRGFGILPVAVDEVVRIAKDKGLKYAITFGETKNDLTTRSFAYAGFDPYILRRKKWFLFRRTIHFEEVPEAYQKTYEKLTAVYRKRREPKP
jgi:GNAT superfamily N-acetyltransferase